MVRTNDLVRGGAAVPPPQPAAAPPVTPVGMASLAERMQVDESLSTPAEEAFASHEPRRPKYRNLLSGVVVILALVAAIAGIIAWQMGQLAGPEPPRMLEGRSLRSPIPDEAEASASTPSSPEVLQAPAPEPVAGATTMAASDLTRPTSPLLVTSPTPAPQAGEAIAARKTPRDTSKGEVPVAQGPRFAVEFGPFLTPVEAERTERQVNQVGYQTVRFRQQTGAGLYGVFVEHLSGPREAQALVKTLGGQGFPAASVLDTGETLRVRVGDALLLRGAVQLGEGLRAKGYQVRVEAQPGEAQTFVIRHGNFGSREEAETRGGELARLGLPNYVVRAK
jgi:hypothetical protein